MFIDIQTRKELMQIYTDKSLFSLFTLCSHPVNIASVHGRRLARKITSVTHQGVALTVYNRYAAVMWWWWMTNVKSMNIILLFKIFRRQLHLSNWHFVAFFLLLLFCFILFHFQITLFQLLCKFQCVNHFR